MLGQCLYATVLHVACTSAVQYENAVGSLPFTCQKCDLHTASPFWLLLTFGGKHGPHVAKCLKLGDRLASLPSLSVSSMTSVRFSTAASASPASVNSVALEHCLKVCDLTAVACCLAGWCQQPTRRPTSPSWQMHTGRRLPACHPTCCCLRPSWWPSK